jgi:AcrR family transcriptional regulator
MSAQPKRRGRPRSERAQLAILKAASELHLQHGIDAVSMDSLAEAAGVSKATIYRWWPSKQALARDVILTEWALPAPPPCKTLRADLLAIVRPWVRQLASRPYARVISSLLVAVHTDAAFAEAWRDDIVDSRRAPARDAFRRAIERGEIAPKVDVELALDLLYGPIYHRLLHTHQPLNDRVTIRVVDATLKAVAG